MYLLMYIYIFCLKIIYFFMKLMHVKNRIVFLSRQSSSVSIDFKLLKDEISKKNKDIDIVVINKKIEKSSLSVIKSFGTILKSMKYLATSKVAIIDGYNIAISVLNHKKDLKVFQIWHSLGAIKKFGYDSLNTDKDKKIAKIMKMHRGYDYINSMSPYMEEYFSKAFNYNKEKLYSLGLPRIDYLINNEKILKKKIYNSYPDLKKKKTILYAPTFRDNNDYKIEELINSIDLNKYNLIVKVHPNMKVEIKNSSVYTCNEFSTLKLISVSDYVITDYSSIFIESTIINKPVYLYVYDIDYYKEKPGLNIDLEKEFKGITFRDAKKLYNSLNKNKYDISTLKEFKDKCIISTKGDITKSLAEFILEKGGIYEKKN